MSSTMTYAVAGAIGLVTAVVLLRPRGKKPGRWERPKQDTYSTAKKGGQGVNWVTEGDAALPIKYGQAGISSVEPVTVMDMFKQAVDRSGDKPALRFETSPGEWKQWTWSEYYNECTTAARAFIQLGLKRHDTVNIIGFNHPCWFFANMGAIAAGGKAAGIYTTNEPKACQYISEHSRAKVVCVEDEKQLQKFLSIRDELPELKAIVMWKGEIPAGVSNSRGKAQVMTWNDFKALAASTPAEEVDARIKNQEPGDCCTLIYTSGTTGNPKAVMISNDNLTWTTRALLEALPEEYGQGDEHVVSYLPLSHVAAQILDIHSGIVSTALKPGYGVVHFARPDALKGSLGETLKAVRPTVFFGVPRVWEKISEKMKAVGAQTKGLKKTIATWAKKQGAEAIRQEQAGGTGEKTLSYAVANKVILSKVKAALGLDRCHSMYTGAAPITMETLEYFGSLGICIQELYGMSECTGPQCVSTPAFKKFGSCGPSLPGCELKIDHEPSRDKPGEGEICFRGRHIMMGYMYNPDKTREAVDEEGWLHSGDVGRVDEYGLLHITGRIKELIITAGGENIAPVPIENHLKALLPGLSNAMVVGDKRKYNVVLVTLKTEPIVETGDFTDKLVAEAAEVSSAKTVGDAQKDAAWKKYIETGIQRYNKEFTTSNAQRIQKFAILPVDFSVPGNDLTATLKLKRPIVSQKYADVIEALYK